MVTKMRVRAVSALAAGVLGWLAAGTASGGAPSGEMSAPPSGLFQPSDIFRIEFAFDPQISPDGARIVYTRQSSDAATDTRYSNLWVLGADGRDHRPLTDGRHRDRNPRWSPDGRKLAFISDREGSAQLYVLELSTGQARRITGLAGGAARPVWSPDGSSIAFFSEVARPPLRLVEIEVPEGAIWRGRAQIHDRLNYRREQRGFDTGHSHAFVVAADGGEARRLTDGDFDHGSISAAEWEETAGLSWDNTGSRLLMAANRRPDAELEPFDSEVYAVGIAGGPPIALTDRRGADGSPAMSPDGRSIAYLGYDDRRLQQHTTRLHVMPAAGGPSVVLTADLDASVRSPRWSEDGRGLYYLFDREGRSILAYQPLTGPRRELATNVGPGYMNYGFAGSFSVSRKGRVAFTYEDAHTVGAIAVLDPGKSTPRVVLRLNEHWLGGKRLAEVEEVWVKSSIDGRRIHGWLMKPPGFDPSKRYPLILEIHGGPTTNIGGDRFDIEKQLYAAHDYLVLFMNPRGSTSYGAEFTNLIHHKYPGDDFYDLMAGVDEIVRRGVVDERRIYVTGGSGGGVLTTWLIGRTDRFAAAVSQYGYVNAVSQALSSDIPFITRSWFPGPPWEYPREYWERSPLSLVGNVKTPTMMMVGLEEVRAPPWESEQYFKALKLRGIDTVLVHFPDEPHGIRIHPSHHMEKVLTILAWFQRYPRQ
jgi:dipeptidyl aminopeptidase/acylaminoacyl peptidase